MGTTAHSVCGCDIYLHLWECWSEVMSYICTRGVLKWSYELYSICTRGVLNWSYEVFHKLPCGLSFTFLSPRPHFTQSCWWHPWTSSSLISKEDNHHPKSSLTHSLHAYQMCGSFKGVKTVIKKWQYYSVEFVFWVFLLWRTPKILMRWVTTTKFSNDVHITHYCRVWHFKVYFCW